MKKLMVAFLMLATCIARADIPHPKTVDFDATYAPDLECFQANEKTWQWTVRMAASKANLTGYTGVMYIARSTGQGQPVVIAGCSVQNASNGIFNAKFSPTDLNTNGSFIYGVGISSGKVTIARQGKIAIYPDPYASGTPITWTNAPVNLSLYTFLGNLLMGGTITAGAFIGDGSGLTGIGGAATNGLAAILYVDASTNALRGELVPLIPTTNGLVGASITNGLVGPSVTNGLAGTSITNGLESIAGSIAKTNDLRGDIADGLDFSAAPTVNGNPVLTNAAAGVDTTALDLAGTRPMTGDSVTLARDVKNRYATTYGWCNVALGSNTTAFAFAAAFGDTTFAEEYGAAFGKNTRAEYYGASFGRRGIGAVGSFVFADSEDADFDRSINTNTFNVRAVGGTYFDTPDLTVTGTVTAAGFISTGINYSRTNSCPSEIVAPEIRAYTRGTLYGTNAIVTLSRSTSIGHAWFQVGYQTNALSPFVAIDGYHLASTTNADATFTNVSIPPQTRISINVTNLATVTSNFNSDIGFKEP